VEAELFHADGGTDGMTDTRKAIVALRNFAKAPKNNYTKLLVIHQRTHSAVLREIYRPYTTVVTTEFLAVAE
jgi:hypothetical protein